MVIKAKLMQLRAQGAVIQQAPDLPLRRPGLVVGGWVGRVVVAREGGGAELV